MSSSQVALSKVLIWIVGPTVHHASMTSVDCAQRILLVALVVVVVGVAHVVCVAIAAFTEAGRRSAKMRKALAECAVQPTVRHHRACDDSRAVESPLLLGVDAPSATEVANDGPRRGNNDHTERHPGDGARPVSWWWGAALTALHFPGAATPRLLLSLLSAVIADAMQLILRAAATATSTALAEERHNTTTLGGLSTTSPVNDTDIFTENEREDGSLGFAVLGGVVLSGVFAAVAIGVVWPRLRCRCIFIPYLVLLSPHHRRQPGGNEEDACDPLAGDHHDGAAANEDPETTAAFRQAYEATPSWQRQIGATGAWSNHPDRRRFAVLFSSVCSLKHGPFVFLSPIKAIVLFIVASIPPRGMWICEVQMSICVLVSLGCLVAVAIVRPYRLRVVNAVCIALHTASALASTTPLLPLGLSKPIGLTAVMLSAVVSTLSAPIVLFLNLGGSNLAKAARQTVTTRNADTSRETNEHPPERSTAVLVVPAAAIANPLRLKT